MAKILESSIFAKFKDKKGKKHVNQYVLFEKIGKGGFASVSVAKYQKSLYVFNN